jgi:uncharacterized protein
MRHSPPGIVPLARATVSTAAVFAAVFAATMAVAGSVAAAATITVVGEAKRTAPPDMAVLTTGVVTSAKTADDALLANSKAVSEVIAALKAAGIAPNDISTSSFSILPQQSFPQPPSREPPKLVGFEVRNSVRIAVRDLGKLGGLLDKVVQSGANQASGLSFALGDPDRLESEARSASVKDAIEQAKSVAAAAGLRLVRIVSIQPEGQNNGPIMPAPMMMMKADAARMAVPVEAGEIEVRSRTVVVYEAEPQ